MSQITLRHILRPLESTGHPHLEVLSVYREYGVIPKSSRADNYNKTPDDLSRYQLVSPGNLVINKMKAWSGSVGVSRYGGIVSPDYLVCAIDERVTGRYMHHWLRSPIAIAEMRARSRGIRPSQERLYWDDLADISMSVPPVEDQQRIADFLDEQVALIDDAIRLRRREIELVEERLVTQIDETITSQPSAHQRTVASLARYINGYPFKPTDFTPTGLPVVRIKQLNDTEADFDYFDGPVDARHRLHNGDLVFSWSGSLSAVTWTRGDAVLNQHLFKVEPVRGVEKAWLLYALKAAIDLFEPFMHGSTMRHITAPMMKEVRVPVPDARQQTHVAATLDAAVAETRDRTSLLDRSTALLLERKQAMITAAVTGQFDVTTPRAIA